MKMDKIQMTKEEFEELYSIIEPDTPQPDLDKLKLQQEETKTVKPEPEFLTEEEQEQDEVMTRDFEMNMENETQ